MTVNSNSELPSHIQEYSDKIQSQYRHVFNTVFENTGSVDRALKAANSVLKKRFKKPTVMDDNTRHDYILHLKDQFLKNIEG